MKFQVAQRSLDAQWLRVMRSSPNGAMRQNPWKLDQQSWPALGAPEQPSSRVILTQEELLVGVAVWFCKSRFIRERPVRAVRRDPSLRLETHQVGRGGLDGAAAGGKTWNWQQTHWMCAARPFWHHVFFLDVTGAFIVQDAESKQKDWEKEGLWWGCIHFWCIQCIIQWDFCTQILFRESGCWSDFDKSTINKESQNGWRKKVEEEQNSAKVDHVVQPSSTLHVSVWHGVWRLEEQPVEEASSWENNGGTEQGIRWRKHRFSFMQSLFFFGDSNMNVEIQVLLETEKTVWHFSCFILNIDCLSLFAFCFEILFWMLTACHFSLFAFCFEILFWMLTACHLSRL